MELTKQLADEDPTITKLADQGIFIWPETEFNGVGMHLKMEHGRSFEAKARVGLSEEGIDRIFMEWKDSGTTVELVLPDSGSAPPQALLFCLDAIAETELAIERSSRVYTGVHYLNLTRDPAHRTYY
ncbi:MAG TPA: hypothetical protein VFT49_03965 [Candidatus Saccharimonadales bacterium]|nr:hypothetical protein [Candidatus Saccharimonadales bacterium]